MARFTKAAVRMVGGTVDESRPGAVVTQSCPKRLLDSGMRCLPLASQSAITATFDLPARAGSTYLSRTHPFVETLATYVLDGALDPDLGIERTAARCGVIRTNEVTALTTLLLVRYRFDVTIRRRGWH